jgi:uncharacterized protein (TIGR02246 family)
VRRTARIAIIGALGATLVGGVGAAAAAHPPATHQMAIQHGKPSAKTIANLFDQWNAALATGDPRKVADRYARDAVLLPTVSNKVRTDRAGIVDYFTHFLKSRPQGVIKESHIDVLDRTTAIDAGVYVFTLTENGKQRKVEARYTFVYELRGGKWLIVNHHSSAMPETTVTH